MNNLNNSILLLFRHLIITRQTEPTTENISSNILESARNISIRASPAVSGCRYERIGPVYRLHMHGLPRPIHIEDGKQVIRFDRTTGWVRENLVNQFRTLRDTADCTTIHTGLHELEFIETQVLDIRTQAEIPADGEVVMANLVDGEEAILESTEGAFLPYAVHYAETFILPADRGAVVIRPANEGQNVKVLTAQVRNR